VTIDATTGRGAGIARRPVVHHPNDIEVTPMTGSNQRPSQPSPSEIRTIARRLQHASDTMGVHIANAFAERMATEGLSRSDEVGMVKATDTVIFFVESTDGAGVTVLGWADQHTCLDRFASLELVANRTAQGSLDAGPADTRPLDDMGPEL